MALTHFAFCVADDRAPVARGVPTAAETKTPSGASAQTAVTSTTPFVGMCRVATDTAVYVAFGNNPTASAATGFLVPAGAVDYFSVAPNDKAAVILA